MSMTNAVCFMYRCGPNGFKARVRRTRPRCTRVRVPPRQWCGSAICLAWHCQFWSDPSYQCKDQCKEYSSGEVLAYRTTFRVLVYSKNYSGTRVKWYKSTDTISSNRVLFDLNCVIMIFYANIVYSIINTLTILLKCSRYCQDPKANAAMY